MESFCDTSFEQLPLPAKRRIDAVCQRFEAAWRAGRPRLEDFCAGADSSERPVLLAELLYIEVEYRTRAGEQPRAEDYLGRFPDDETVVRAVLPDPVEAARHTAEGLPAGTTQPAGTAGSAPRTVPGYEVLGELGQGGMGVVFKARHLALNRLVALKFIRATGTAAARYRERFRLEAEVVARLRHPNIVQIYDIGEVDGQCFLALEYAEGGSLRERLAGSSLPSRAAVLLLEPLARAVQHAHRQGVVHRDLKPANVLLIHAGDSITASNRPMEDWRPPGDLGELEVPLPPLARCIPKLTDFGLAKLLHDEASEQGLGVGTPNYMAPEQVLDGEVGPACDVWGLGVVLYELLTGEPPFRAASAAETLRRVLNDDPLPPSKLQPGVPRALDAICLKCLAKDPAKRYAGARELAQELRSFLAGDTVRAAAPAPLLPALGWARHRPWLAALLLGLLALLAVLAGRWFLP
jgi:serine/threonine protein kinase